MGPNNQVLKLQASIKSKTEEIECHRTIEIKAAFELGENGFRKCFSINVDVWLRMENTFSGNAFQFDRVLGVK